MKRLLGIILAVVISVAAMTGCGNIDVSKLVEKPIDYKRPPYAEDAEKVYCPLPLEDLKGMYIDVSPVVGNPVRLSGMEYVAQIILNAAADSRAYLEEDFKGSFHNTVTVYSKDDKELLKIMMASDETLYARQNADSPIFRVPQYAYYAIEASLWQVGGSLAKPMDKWKPKESMSQMELHLPHDIKTMIHQIHGYSDAYFVNFKIYSTKVDKQYIKIYALVGYGGYAVEMDEKPKFALKFHDVTPVQFIYTWVNGESWRLTKFKLPPVTDEQRAKPNFSLQEGHVRSILPFKDTQTAMIDLGDTSDIMLEIHRQALNYLRENGITDCELDDKIN